MTPPRMRNMVRQKSRAGYARPCLLSAIAPGFDAPWAAGSRIETPWGCQS
jgi:hypothetical protein